MSEWTEAFEKAERIARLQVRHRAEYKAVRAAARDRLALDGNGLVISTSEVRDELPHKFAEYIERDLSELERMELICNNGGGSWYASAAACDAPTKLTELVQAVRSVTG